MLVMMSSVPAKSAWLSDTSSINALSQRCPIQSQFQSVLGARCYYVVCVSERWRKMRKYGNMEIWKYGKGQTDGKRSEHKVDTTKANERPTE